MSHPYWQKQTRDAPLFPDILWQRPENKSQAGKLLLIGGNLHGFAAVAQAYTIVRQTGAGECQAILPDALKKVIDPRTLDCLFAPSNPSGGLSKDALPLLKASAAWADAILLIGDHGRNSETAIVLERLLAETPTLTIITRDAIDLLRAGTSELLQRPSTVLVATLAQIQKIFQAVYYPKTILFSMQLTTLVEALHAFTITHPITLVTFHHTQLLVAQNGTVTTTPWEEPLLIWRGDVAARAAVFTMEQPRKPLEAITAGLVS